MTKQAFIFFTFTLFVGSFFLSINSCTTDPFRVEIKGPFIDTIATDTIVELIEEDLCSSGIISFEREILPLLVSSCAYSGCHDTETAEEGIIIESYSQIMKEIVANNAGESEIYQAITENPNEDDFMPPKPAIALSYDQINLIKNWIDQGAENTTCNVPCNSTDASFSSDVMPLIETHCLGCHQPSNTLGDVNLVDFEHIRSYAFNGQLMGTISHLSGYEPMPETALKMTDCQIATIKNWITEGYQNN